MKFFGGAFEAGRYGDCRIGVHQLDEGVLEFDGDGGRTLALVMIDVGRDEKTCAFESRAFGSARRDHDPNVIELQTGLISGQRGSSDEQDRPCGAVRGTFESA